MENCTTRTAADVDTDDLDCALLLLTDRLKAAAELESSSMRTTLLRRCFADLGSVLNHLPA